MKHREKRESTALSHPQMKKIKQWRGTLCSEEHYFSLTFMHCVSNYAGAEDFLLINAGRLNL